MLLSTLHRVFRQMAVTLREDFLGLRRDGGHRFTWTVAPLEKRCMLDGDTLDNATLIDPVLGLESKISDSIDNMMDVDIYRLELTGGQRIRFDIDTPNSSLDSVLRVFDSMGGELARNNDSDGRDSALIFDSTADGTFYVGVSGAFNLGYDPLRAESGFGFSTGTYDLKIVDLAAAPDLVGTGLQQQSERAAWGDVVTVKYTVENQGSTDSGSFEVQIKLSDDDNITSGGFLDFDEVLTTESLEGLASGASIQRSLSITLPGNPGEPPLFFTEPDRVYLGLVIDSQDAIGEADESNNRNQGDGLDFVSLAIKDNNDTLSVAGQLEARIGQTTSVFDSIDSPSDVDLFAVELNAEQRLTVDIDTQAMDGSLDSFVRIFDDVGRELAANDNDGESLDSLINFTAPGNGIFYIGVTASGHEDYDPNLVAGGSGLSTGQYELRAQVEPKLFFGEIRGTKFNDLNESGTREDGESGVPGWTVFLDDNNNDLLDDEEPFAITDEFGNYGFSNLSPGNYIVAEVSELGWQPTFPYVDEGLVIAEFRFSDERGDPDAHGFTSSGALDQWHLSSGRGLDPGHSAETSFYFGAGEGANGGGRYQNNADGILLSPPIDLREAIGPVRLDFNHFLTAAFFDTATVAAVVDGAATVLSDSDTLRGFGNRTSGFETVKLDLSDYRDKTIQIQFQFTNDSGTALEGWYVDDIIIRTTPGKHLVALNEDQVIENVDFGNHAPPGEIRGAKFLDIDSNGSRRFDEPGLGGWTIFLDENSNGIKDQTERATVTDENGEFVLQDLSFGAYTIAEVPQDGWQRTLPSQTLFLNAAFSDAAGNERTDGFTVEGTKNQWHLSTGRSQDEGHSSAASFYFGQGEGPDGGGSYTDGADGILTSPLIDLTDISEDVFLDFNQFVDVESSDLISVAVLADRRVTIVADNDAIGGLGNTVGFEPMRLDLTSFLGQRIRIQFRLESRSFFAAEGWYVDDIRVAADGGLAAYRVWLAPSQMLDHIEFGSFRSFNGQISGAKFNDLNRNGSREPNEPGLADWTIYLDANQNDRLDEGEVFTKTDERGNYRFSQLPPNFYRVAELPSTRFAQTSPTGSTETVVFQTDFSDESGEPDASGFTFSGSLDQWHLSTGRSLDVGHSAQHSLYFGAGEGPTGGGSYADSSDGTATSPLIDLSQTQGDVTVQFNHFLQVEDDTARVVILVGEDATVIANSNQFDSLPSATTTFEPVTLDASEFAGEMIRLQFHFQSNDFFTFEGWYVDDVVVTAGAVTGAHFARLQPDQVLEGLDFGNAIPPESEPNDSIESADPISPNSARIGEITAEDDVDLFAVTVDQPGRIIVNVRASESSMLDAQLSLLAENGQMLISSDDAAPGDLDPWLVQHLPAGHYFLAVSASRGSDTPGGYMLQTDFVPSEPPFETITVQDSPEQVLPGDFDEDGWPDLLAISFSDGVALLLNTGDGTFRQGLRIPVEGFGRATVADFNSDGHLDVASTGGSAFSTREIVVLLGHGDGTFNRPVRTELPILLSPGTLTADDFNEDGILDLATWDQPSDIHSQADAVLLLGRGDGSFELGQRFPVGLRPSHILADDFNGDAHTDLALPNEDSFTLDGKFAFSILLGNGDGTFEPETRVETRFGPFDVISGDFDGDGDVDLIASDVSDNLLLFSGIGDGTFESAKIIAEGSNRPVALVAEDLNGDAHLDLVVANESSREVAVLLGLGDGSFRESARFAVTAPPGGIATTDVNRDGRIDIVTDVISITFGVGDGTFQADERIAVGQFPEALVAADFNNDDRIDLATVNRGDFFGPSSDDVSVLLARGSGEFQDDLRNNVGPQPASLTAADLNRDGRIDLAVANGGQFFGAGDNTVSVLLGLGNGSFSPDDPANRVEVGNRPVSIVSADLNADGVLDLITANDASNTLSVLIGSGDGTFQPQVSLAVGERPSAVTVADLNLDGVPDVAAASSTDNLLHVLLGQGDASFAPATEIPMGQGPRSLVAADFDGDGFPDLATTEITDSTITVFFGSGDGSFPRRTTIQAGERPETLMAGDLNGDEIPDLVATNFGFAAERFGGRELSLLLGRGDGTFEPELRIPVGSGPVGVSIADLNDDGRVDIATSNNLSNDITILAGLGNGQFVQPSDLALGRVDSTPTIADLNGDGIADVVLQARDGRILYRQGAGSGTFDAPTVVNPNNASLDVAVAAAELDVVTLVAIDKSGETVSAYQLEKSGRFTRTVTPLSVEDFSSRIVSADLNNDGRADLLVNGTISGDAVVLLATGQGDFTEAFRANIGRGATDIELADLNSDDLTDALFTNEFSGDVAILLNQGLGRFEKQVFRGSNGLSAIGSQGSQSISIESLQRTVDGTVGDFDGDGNIDFGLANQGSNSISLLLGKGNGAFSNPSDLFLAASPLMIESADFNGDGRRDLALLLDEEHGVSILVQGANGAFQKGIDLDVGNVPAGLEVHDIDNDGNSDLLVGNEFGDLLSLLGNGDGTFREFTRAERQVAVAIADLDGDKINDVVTANHSRDKVSVIIRGPDELLEEVATRDTEQAVDAPEGVQLVDVDNDGFEDLLVANSGANEVLVFLGDGGGQFKDGAMSFSAGTNPVSVTVADAFGLPLDFNQDDFLDLVVTNQGSNDVSILFSKKTEEGLWNGFSPGPRLDVGMGPVSSELLDQNGDGQSDLLVTNRVDGTISVLPAVGEPGAGGGFFDDRNPSIIDLGGPTAGQGAVFLGNSGFAALGDGSVTLIDAARGSATTIISGSSGARALAPLDIDSDGNSELVVARSNGSVSLFLQGQNDAFFLDRTFTHENLQSPSSVELSRLSDRFEIYVTDEGEDLVTVFPLPARDTDRLSDVRQLLAELPVDDIAPSGTMLALARDTMTELIPDADQLLTNIEPMESGTSTGSAFIGALKTLWQTMIISFEPLWSSAPLNTVSQTVSASAIPLASTVITPATPLLTALQLGWQLANDQLETYQDAGEMQVYGTESKWFRLIHAMQESVSDILEEVIEELNRRSDALRQVEHLPRKEFQTAEAVPVADTAGALIESSSNVELALAVNVDGTETAWVTEIIVAVCVPRLALKRPRTSMSLDGRHGKNAGPRRRSNV